LEEILKVLFLKGKDSNQINFMVFNPKNHHYSTSIVALVFLLEELLLDYKNHK
jgi:hypothetical protein